MDSERHWRSYFRNYKRIRFIGPPLMLTGGRKAVEYAPNIRTGIRRVLYVLTLGITLAGHSQNESSQQATKLGACDFVNAIKPSRVDNTCKAVLDNVSLRLRSQSDSTLVIVGNSASTEKGKNLALQRARASKEYLVGGEAKQGIDPARVKTCQGKAGTKTAEFWLVPSGASFNCGT